jgi:general stress protein 26
MIVKSKRSTDLVAVVLATAILALAFLTTPAPAQISARDAQALSAAELIFVATIRKDGNQSRAAPVWFTTSADRKAILIQTRPNTWKAKRIRRGSRVLVWIGSPIGPAFIGNAAIVNDVAVWDKILADFREKYWQSSILGMGPSRGEFANGEVLAIIITPLRDLREGFTSAPGTPPPQLGNPTH